MEQLYLRRRHRDDAQLYPADHQIGTSMMRKPKFEFWTQCGCFCRNLEGDRRRSSEVEASKIPLGDVDIASDNLDRQQHRRFLGWAGGAAADIELIIAGIELNIRTVKEMAGLA